jgi:hypothetical protein
MYIVRECSARSGKFAAHAIHRVVEFVQPAIVRSHRVVQRCHQIVDEREPDFKLGKTVFK